MKIYLVRHGETSWNKEKRVQGSADIPLNENGILLAEITSEEMKDIPVEMIYTSPLIRARKTAEIMRRNRDIPVRIDDRLQEMGFGKYEGTFIKEASEQEGNVLHNFVKHPEKYEARDGENFSQVIARARSFIDEVLVPIEKMYSNIMIASHGASIRCFLRCVENRPLSEFWGGIYQNNCAVTILELKAGKLKILEEGKVYYHLPEADSGRIQKGRIV